MEQLEYPRIEVGDIYSIKNHIGPEYALVIGKNELKGFEDEFIIYLIVAQQIDSLSEIAFKQRIRYAGWVKE